MNGATDQSLELRSKFSEMAALQPEAAKPNEIPHLTQSFGKAAETSVQPAPQEQLPAPDMGTVDLVGQSLTQNYEGLKAPQSMVSEGASQTMKLGGELLGNLFGKTFAQTPDPIMMRSPQPAMINRPRGPGVAGIF